MFTGRMPFQTVNWLFFIRTFLFRDAVDAIKEMFQIKSLSSVEAWLLVTFSKNL